MTRGRTIRTPKKEAQFLDILRKTANVTQAAKATGITRQTAHDWREQDAEFAKAWEDAINEAMETAEGELYRRAVEGVDKPVFYQGVPCGVIREYSNSLLTFMLKAHKPHKYREQSQVELTGPGGSMPVLNVIINGSAPTPAPGPGVSKPGE